ncbi:MAG: hypothetical protein JNJ43_08605 [Anaerolineales bacterium]|nr:hypothetical protein [Anaerolineales bacterium]
MQNNRLGCLTGTGFITAIITLFVIVGFAFASGGQMFSSGELNNQPGETIGGVNAHAQIPECKACHTAPWESETMANRCVACHIDIAAELLNVEKLHGAIVNNDSSITCRDCHREHRGANASLTELGDNVFPHEALGYSLNGHQLTTKGEAFVCSDCHGDDVTTFASDSCVTCHSDIDIVFTQTHLLTFGQNCLDCHDGVDRFGDDFNHNIFAFQLIGEHANLYCTACHLNARSVTDLESAPQECYSCHQMDDAHNGQFGTDCSACHTPNSWEDATFDHNLSNFPLTGAHTVVACESCHINGRFAGTPSTCVSCHSEPAFHAGQFGTDCASCHTTTAWKPALFNGRHTFPLNHGGGAPSCATCHPSSFVTYTCYGCHEHNPARIEEKHREEGISNFQNCVQCHADGREHDD